MNRRRIILWNAKALADAVGMKGVLWKEIFEKNLNDKRKVQQTKIYKKGAERQTYGKEHKKDETKENSIEHRKGVVCLVCLEKNLQVQSRKRAFFVHKIHIFFEACEVVS